MYGPSTCTELNVIGGSLGRAGVFGAASLSAFADAAGLGVASIGWTGIARLGAGAGWAVSATVKLNVAAQHNSLRELAMEMKVKTKPLYLAEAYSFATRGMCSCSRQPRTQN